MATTPFPQPQVPVAEDQQEEVFDMTDIDADMGGDLEEQPDGSVVVQLDDFKTPAEDADFYANLAEEFSPLELDKLGMRYLELIEKDKEARSDRDKQYEEGLRRTGMGNDAPGGANFMGANKVVHPIMAEACVDFESRAIKELFPPDGPVRTNILGDASEEKTELAERKRDYMNWQLTEQIEEFRDEMEQMLTQLPLGGSQYLKMYYDDDKCRPCAEFVPIDNVLLPFAAANFYTAQRVTEVQDITQMEFERRVECGLYRDIDIVRSALEPETTRAGRANDKIEGRSQDDNSDGVRRVYHVYTWLKFDEDSQSDSRLVPYILIIDDNSSEVIGLYRNWEQGDDTFSKLDWLVEFKFIPWRGAYAIGFPHLIGGLSAALTGSLRALLDTAHINNAATMLKIKGARVSGQSQQVEITQITEIEATPGIDDIRKLAMPMPFNPPSPVLLELLGWLTSAAKGVVTTSEEKIADINANTPVGTTQALIEQGAVVFSAIHARLHNSQGRVLKILARLNRWYLDEQRKGDVVAELPIRPEDFTRNTDVIPVSDPHIFSETHRMAQNQAVISLDKQYPGIMDPKAIVKRTLKQLKISNIKELMPNMPEPTELNAAEENVAMALGRGAFAYPHQNQIAHIQTHLDFAKSPMYGKNPLIAPAFMPAALEHIKQHLVLWYSGHMKEYVEGSLNGNLADYGMPEITAQVDKLFGLASQHVALDAEKVFERVLPVLEEMAKAAAQYKPTPPLDPSDQVFKDTAMAETQRKAAKDQADLQLRAEQDRATNLIKTRDQQIKVGLAAAEQLTQERTQIGIDEMGNQVKSAQEQSALETLQPPQGAM